MGNAYTAHNSQRNKKHTYIYTFVYIHIYIYTNTYNCTCTVFNMFERLCSLIRYSVGERWKG